MPRRPVIHGGRLNDPICVDLSSGVYAGVADDAVCFLEKAAQSRGRRSASKILFDAMLDSSWRAAIEHLCALVGFTRERLSNLLTVGDQREPAKAGYIQELQEITSAAITICLEAHGNILCPEDLLVAILESKRHKGLGTQFDRLADEAREAIRPFIYGQNDPRDRYQKLLNDIRDAKNGSQAALDGVVEFTDRAVSLHAHEVAREFRLPVAKRVEAGRLLVARAVETFEGRTVQDFGVHFNQVVSEGLEEFCTGQR